MLKIIKYAAVQNNPVVIATRPVLQLVPECGELLSDSISEHKEEALEEAKRVLDDSRRKAEECLAQAASEAEKIKQEAIDAGRQEGYQNGYNEGIRCGKEQAESEMQQKINRAVEKAQSILTCAEQEYKESIIEAEHEIIKISLAVARKILAREIEENPVVVLPIVRAALEKVRDQDQIAIRVSPDDFELVLQAKRDLQMMLGRENVISIVHDHTVNPGGCLIDTPYGMVDASIDSQFQALQQAVKKVMP